MKQIERPPYWVAFLSNHASNHAGNSRKLSVRGETAVIKSQVNSEANCRYQEEGCRYLYEVDSADICAESAWLSHADGSSCRIADICIMLLETSQQSTGQPKHQTGSPLRRW